MMKRNFDLLKEGRLPSFVHASRIAVLLRTVNLLKTHLWSLGVLYIALLLSHFAHNSFLSSHFGHSLFGVDSLNLPTSVSPGSVRALGKLAVLPKLQSPVQQQSLAKHIQCYRQEVVKYLTDLEQISISMLL